MENNATYPQDSILSGIPILTSQLGYSQVDLSDYLDIAYECLQRHIKCIAEGSYLYIGKTDENGELELPCNVFYVDAVSENTNTFIKSLDGLIIHTIAGFPVYSTADYSNLYAVGRFINFEYVSPRVIKTTYPGLTVRVLYRGSISDADGRPLIRYKDAKAIAYFYHMIKTKIRYNMNQTTIDKLQVAQADSDKYISQAKTPDYITQNQMSKILDSKTTWDRHWYHTNFKYNR